MSSALFTFYFDEKAAELRIQTSIQQGGQLLISVTQHSAVFINSQQQLQDVNKQIRRMKLDFHT